MAIHARRTEEAAPQQTRVRRDERSAQRTVESSPAAALQQPSAPSSSPLTPAALLNLQQTVGNRAVVQLLARREGAAAGRGHTAVQRRLSSGSGATGGGVTNDEILSAAQGGLQAPASQLPHRDRIQRSFGPHDVSGIRAHVGAEATVSAESMNAAAYATGEHVVFAGPPDLHTAAHEAAHVLQQRAGALPSGGVGAPGDAYERHAEAVADRVATGRSAADLLSHAAEPRPVSPSAPVQRALSESDASQLDEWMQGIKVTVAPATLTGIKQDSDTLADAKKAVIVAAVASKIDQYLKSPAKSQKFGAEFAASKQMAKSVPVATASLLEELLDSYNPETHHFILLGNSPAVLAPGMKRARVDYSLLPLGGLTDPNVVSAVFGLVGSQADQFEAENQRSAYQALVRQNPKLQKYLGTFLETLKETDKSLVVVDYTSTGVSALAVADMLRIVSAEVLKKPRTVKLFTYSQEFPAEGSVLAKQTDYDLVAAKPEGQAEKIFAELEHDKVLKDRLLLYVTRSVPLTKLLAMEDTDFSTVFKDALVPELADRLFQML